MTKIFTIIFVSMMLVLSVACGNAGKNESDSEPTGKSRVRIIHAGSLSIPFKELADAFMKKNPGAEILLEAHGSRTCARRVIDLHQEVDVMGSADSAVIRELLMPDFADFCIDFTTNEMVIMYTEKSKYADTISPDNWFDVLLKPEVEYGHSDPNADPCGYRSLLAWQLAEIYYRKENLYDQLKEKMPEKNIRPKEVDLLAMLETGELDYIFIYRSVAEQHNAKFVVLPDEVNLKSPELAELYQNAKLNITGKTPGEWVEVKGEPMIYGITLLKNAPNPKGAIEFIAFVLGPEGQEIMRKNGQPELAPPRVDNKDKLPETLKTFFQ